MKKSMWFTGAGILALSFALVGCSKKEEAAPAAATEQTDLSRSTDIFSEPVAAPQSSLDPTAIVAVVEGKEITQGEVNEEVAGVVARMQGRVPPERIAQLQATLAGQTLDALVTKEILMQTVEKEKIEVTDDEITKAIDKIKASLPPGKELNDLLQGNDKTEADFRKDLTLELRINKLIEGQVESLVKPTDEEITQYYNENKEEFDQPESVHASHILIATEENDTDAQKAEKKAKAEELRAKLVAGDDFAKCAGDNSDCPSKAKGGDLGTFSRGQMVKPFEDAAFSQKVGEIGPVIETQFGYHIIKVEEHNEAKTLALDEIKEKLSDYLTQQKKQIAARDYVMALKEKAHVTYPQNENTPGTAPEMATPAPSSAPKETSEAPVQEAPVETEQTTAAPSEPTAEAAPQQAQ